MMYIPIHLQFTRLNHITMTRRVSAGGMIANVRMRTMKSKKGIHCCWADFADEEAAIHGFGSDEWLRAYNLPSATCLLTDGHKGKHRWTADNGIEIQFVDRKRNGKKK